MKNTYKKGRVDMECAGALYRIKIMEKRGQRNIKPWNEISGHRRRLWSKRAFYDNEYLGKRYKPKE